RAIREADEADLIPAVEPEPEPQSLAAPRRVPLGRLLVENGALSESDLEEALERQRTDARPLGQILMDMGAVTPQELARALTGQHGLDSSHTLRRRLAAEEVPDASGPLEALEERYLVRDSGSS